MPPKRGGSRITKGGKIGHGPRWTPFEVWNSTRTSKEIIPGAVCKQIESFYADPRRWTLAGTPQRPRLGKFPAQEHVSESEYITDYARAAIAEPVAHQGVTHCYTCFACQRQPDDPECGVECYDRIHSGEGGDDDGSGEDSMKDFFRKWLEIRDTGSEKGYGVFVKSNGRYEIPKGSYLGHYIGEIIPGPTKPSNWNKGKGAKRLKKKSGDEDNRYLYEPQVGLEYELDRPLIDAGKMGNWTRFMNSSCEPNVSERIMQIGKVRVIAFFANKDLVSGDELCIYYGDDYFKGHELLCTCDAAAGGKPHDPTTVGARLKAAKRTAEALDWSDSEDSEES